MWFDARAKLNEIAGQPPAAFAATVPPVSQVSQVSQRPKANKPALRVAEVASVATPPRSNLESTPPARADRLDQGVAAFPYGSSPGGRPLAWTGRVVSLADWRTLTDQERHGPNGRHWCGVTKQWLQPP